MSTYAPIKASDKWFQNEDKLFLFWLQEDGVDIDATQRGFDMVWALADSAQIADTLRTTIDAQIVDYVEGDDDPSPGTVHANAGASVTVPANTTADLDDGTYYHELWNTATGERQVLAYGDAVLRPSRYRDPAP